MKAITALVLLKKHGLVHPQMRLRNLKWVKQVLEYRDWKEFVRYIMFSRYLSGPLPDEVRIPEVGFSVGGTLRLKVITKRGPPFDHG